LLLRTILNERDAEQRRSEWRAKITAMLAHDFRSSLTVIRACTDLLQSFREKRDDLEPYDAIRKSVEDLTAMSEEALLMSRMSNNALNVQMQPELIYDIVVEAAQRYKSERAIVISRSVETVMGDRRYLVRVFDNLIGNAIKYSPAPTPIVVEIAPCEEGNVEIAVTDRGRGIDSADIPHVFEEFWRAEATSERGSGLGLFIVKEIVDAHGGSVAVESEPGEGTTVRVRLPVGSLAGNRVPAG
jgi:signal transduction histidine kinase